MKKLILLMLLFSSFSWASTTKEQIKSSLNTLSSFLPAGVYTSQEVYKKGIGSSTLKPWKGKFCEVTVTHDNSQPNAESYSIDAFVKENDNATLFTHAHMNFGLLSVLGRTSIRTSVSDDSKSLQFEVEHAGWEKSTLSLTMDSFTLKIVKDSSRGVPKGEVYCGKLVLVKDNQ